MILDLCAGSGAWSKPYKEAGYHVLRVDLARGFDVRLFEKPDYRVRGILAAPPCNKFSRARMMRGFPTKEEWIAALAIVDACLRVITVCQPRWWALENPDGWLKKWLGKPALIFNPCDYGDPWTKKTCLWGSFKEPVRHPTKPIGSWVRAGKGRIRLSRKGPERAITPAGFARAFFEANP